MDEVVNDRLSALEKKHRDLKQELAGFLRRSHLTPEEQRHITNLKKLKLQAKDQLFALRGHF